MRPDILARSQPQLLSVLRIVAGLIFMQHGLQKLVGWFGGVGDGGTVELLSLMGLAGILEAVGGGLIALGLFTRITAFVMAGEMAAAYFMAHFPRSFFPIENGGELAVLLCFVFLYLSAAGGGPWSVDSALAGEKGGDRGSP